MGRYDLIDLDDLIDGIATSLIVDRFYRFRYLSLFEEPVSGSAI